MRTLAIFALCAALVACSDSGTEPAGLKPETFVGTWGISVEESYGCFSSLAFRVPDDATDRVHGGTMSVLGDWGFSADDLDKNLTGHFNLDAETFRFVLWWKNFRAEYTGTIKQGPRLDGRLTAPKGMFNAFSACNASATATKL